MVQCVGKALDRKTKSNPRIGCLEVRVRHFRQASLGLCIRKNDRSTHQSDNFQRGQMAAILRKANAVRATTLKRARPLQRARGWLDKR